MEPRSLRVDGSDGLSLHVVEWSQEGVPLLLLHGFSNEAHIWDDFAPEVADYYRVLALDLRGHGDSDWDPEHRYEYANHVADVEAAVEGLGIERLVLVGHSLGGRIATYFAARHPEMMAGFVIVDSAPELDRRGTLRITMDVEQNREPTFASIAEYERMLSLAYPVAMPSAIKRMALHGVKERPDGRFELKMDPAFRGALGRRISPEEMAAHEERTTAELWDALAKISCPTLVVRGAASDIVSADVADRMADDVLRDGRLAVVPQSGHSVMTDNPKGFRDAVCSLVLGE